MNGPQKSTAGPRAPADASLPREAKIRRPADFRRAHASPAFAADAVLVVKVCANGLAQTRLGLSVSRKTGNAVTRNRWKRRIREAFRLSRRQLPMGLDIVVRPKKDGVPEFESIHRSLPRLVERAARGLATGPTQPAPGDVRGDKP